MSASSHVHRRRSARGLRRTLARAVEGIDVVALLERIARSEVGRPWRERFAALPPAWDQGEALAELAVELTCRQLAAEGQKVDRARIAERVEGIRHRYDHALYQDAGAAVATLLSVLFQPADPDLIFVSPDRRELAHAEELHAQRKKGRAVVYLVNHSSHLDEFLVAVVLALEGLGLPLFAAGANMMAIASIARVLMLGSYVVQRRGADRTVLAALYNYCRAISESGGQQGIFLEAWHGGARTRDGSLRYPRRLVTLRGALAAEAEVVVQPVAVSYAMVPEDLALAARGSGLCWLRGLGPGRVLGAMLRHPRTWLTQAARGLYGRAFVSLGRPRLLSELRAEHARANHGRHLDEHVALYAIDEIARIKKVMGSQVVARALVRARRSPDKVDLAAAVAEELERVAAYHREQWGQEPDLEDFLHQHSPAEVAADGLAALRRRKVLARWRRDERGLPLVRSRAGLSFYANHGDRRIYSPTADQNLVVVGAGDWGFALTCLVGRRILDDKTYANASLTLYDWHPESARELAIERRPPGRFSDHRLPKNAFVTSDPVAAFKKASEVVLAASPSELAGKARVLLGHSEQPLKVVVVTAGFDPDSHRLPCQVVSDIAAELGRSDVAVYALSGPVTEADLVEERPARGVLSGPEAGLASLAALFTLPPVEVVPWPEDAVGVQAAAVLARIYAMWGNFLMRSRRLSGAAELGHYLTRAAEEARRLGLALGGKAETFAAHSPAWTAVLTAEGLHGPGRELGRRLGSVARRGGDVAGAAAKLWRQPAEEGRRPWLYRDLHSAWRRARELGLELPLLEEAHRTIHGG